MKRQALEARLDTLPPQDRTKAGSGQIEIWKDLATASGQATLLSRFASGQRSQPRARQLSAPLSQP